MRDRDQFHFLQVIRKLEIFRDLGLEEAQLVLGLCERCSFAAGDVVWRVGDDSSRMVVLLSGRLRVLDGEGVQIGDLLPGGSYGEMGGLTGHPRFVTLVAAEVSTALSLTRRALRGLATQQPPIYITILETAVDILTHRLTDTQHTGHGRGTTPGAPNS